MLLADSKPDGIIKRNEMWLPNKVYAYFPKYIARDVISMKWVEKYEEAKMRFQWYVANFRNMNEQET